MHNYLQIVIWNNRILDYLVAAELLLGSLAAVWLARIPLLRWAKRPEERRFYPKLAEEISRPFFQMFQALSPYFALEHLKLPAGWSRALHTYAAVMITIGLARLGVRGIRFFMLDYWSHRKGDRRVFDRQFQGLMPVVTIGVWGASAVFLLDNLGVNISAVVAGLGIGGVAIALASQAVLADLFSYFAIVLDRPFDIGDVITVDQFTGTVEYIGIKTTRLRSTSGEQLVLANSDLTKSRLRNHRRLQTRRVEFVLPLAYETPVEQLETLPKMIGELIASRDGVRFNQAAITAISAAGIDVKVCYTVLNDSFSKHLVIQQDLLLSIKRLLDEGSMSLARLPLAASPRFLQEKTTEPHAGKIPAREVVSGDTLAA